MKEENDGKGKRKDSAWNSPRKRKATEKSIAGSESNSLAHSKKSLLVKIN